MLQYKTTAAGVQETTGAGTSVQPTILKGVLEKNEEAVWTEGESDIKIV